MKCENCGARLAKDTHSCPNCGEVVSTSAGETQAKRRTEIYLVLAIAVLAALLVYALHCTVDFVMRGEETNLLTPVYTMGGNENTYTSNPYTGEYTPSLYDPSGLQRKAIYGDEPAEVTESEEPVATEDSETDIDYTDPSSVSLMTPLIGRSSVTAEDLADFYEENSTIDFPSYYRERGVSLERFAQMYIDECLYENIRADIAFAQMLHETGFLKFGGKVDIGQFNFAGLGVAMSPPGVDFAELYGDSSLGIQMGVRAQVQHLKAYASTEQLVQESVDPTFSQVNRGSALTLGDLVDTWSADSNYATAILKLVNEMGTD